MEEEEIKINLTSLCDICLTLLIVFIVGGTFMIQPALKIDKPEAATNEETEETDKVVVYISKDGKFAVDELIVPFEKIEDLVTQRLRKTKSKFVVIEADKEALHGDLMEVMAVAKKCGASRITIGTTQKK